MEVAIGKFPYKESKEWTKNVFDQINQVVHGDPPQLPTGSFSETFEDFTRLWSVNYFT